jgi:4,5-DOPA dioxygenase extradiol
VARQPALFVSHGSPMMAIEPSPARDFLAGLGADLARPDAILMVSAHFDEPVLTLTGSTQPPTIHDFGEFPNILYQQQYPASGAPVLAQEIAALLRDAWYDATVDPARGLDHGAWVPLMLLYPEADIPVVQLSIDSRRSSDWHVALGAALAPLRDRNILIIGSGSMTHNLRAFFTARPAIDARPPEWVAAFADWIDARLIAGDVAAVTDLMTRAPDALRNHPTADHILPLHVAMGAGGMPLHARRLHRSTTYGVLAMDAYAFD